MARRIHLASSPPLSLVSVSNRRSPPLPTPPAVYSIICLRRETEKHRSPSMYGAHAHASNMQGSSNSNPNHFDQPHCEFRCDCSLFDDR